MNPKLHVVLMAGGSGTRFWPYSRQARPKQFLDILNTGKTLIQSTYERFLPLCPQKSIFVVTTKNLAPLVKKQLPISDDQILHEPEGKNTAPCIAFSCRKIKQYCPDATIIVSPSDHIILNEKTFQNIATTLVSQASKKDKLITLGINPRGPETGYGYIQYSKTTNLSLKKVSLFTEKPPIETAKKFIQEGNFLWNSGIFVWHVDTILEALEKYQPKMTKLFKDIHATFNTPDEAVALQQLYKRVDAISIDHGVMEKADNVYVWPSDLAWSDLGSWSSLHAIQNSSPTNHNLIEANALLYDTQNSIIKAPKDKLVVVQGLENYLVGSFNDVIIVCRKDNEASFKKFIADIKINPDLHAYL